MIEAGRNVWRHEPSVGGCILTSFILLCLARALLPLLIPGIRQKGKTANNS